MQKGILFGKNIEELKQITDSLHLPSYTAKQIAQWMYSKRIFSIEEMSNISAQNRNILEEFYELGCQKPIQTQTSTDGTQKFLFETSSSKHIENYIESVYIPAKERATLCLSSQSGCRMNCQFCATGNQGFNHHLLVHEILNQYYSIPQSKELSNLVFMGMGEPFDNIDEVLKALKILTSEWGFALSPRRITVSSVGILPGLKRFLEESECHLAISLHSPFDQEREDLMPIQKVYPIDEIIACLKNYNWSGQRRLSFEYILIQGVNDSLSHARMITKKLRGLQCRINLISYHHIPNKSFVKSDEETSMAFRDFLSSHGLFCTIRQSKGEDILAACGLLAKTRKESKNRDK
ncbi:MAG: 23S rRNA (adenine(2503)-C(2))-methyltransferase RlmN [Bacteroidales bacterium]